MRAREGHYSGVVHYLRLSVSGSHHDSARSRVGGKDVLVLERNSGK